MNIQEIRWECYPRVASFSAARSFVERLALKGKRPKTVDAYARSIEDLLAYFTETDPSKMLEGDEGDLDGYIAHLKQQRPKKHRGGGVMVDETKIRYLTGQKLSESTIAQRIVACRLFYDFLLRKRLRSDPVNPIERGNDGRSGQRPVRGPVSKKQYLPWLPSDEIWEQFVRHVILSEDARTKAMILLAYDAALRREA